MPKFKVGDICRVIEVDEIDREVGIEAGDLVEVLEYSYAPYCKFLNRTFEFLDRCPLTEDQLELVED